MFPRASRVPVRLSLFCNLISTWTTRCRVERQESRVDLLRERPHRHSPNQKQIQEPELLRVGRHHDQLPFRQRQVQTCLRAAACARQHDARAPEDGWP